MLTDAYMLLKDILRGSERQEEGSPILSSPVVARVGGGGSLGKALHSGSATRVTRSPLAGAIMPCPVACISRKLESGVRPSGMQVAVAEPGVSPQTCCLPNIHYY